MTTQLLSIGKILLTSLVVIVAAQARSAEESAMAGGNYLYMQQYIVGPGMTPNDAVAQGSEMVKAMRKTGDYRTVRLYIHNTGPQMAIYVLAEPKSWQSIETGAVKALEEMKYMSRVWQWGGHSDNLLSEVPVE